MKTFDYLIVGAGLTGCVLAERIASRLGKRVLLVERRDHVGGNVYDFVDDHGILVHKYGPHILHTNSHTVWRYLSQFTSWRPYEHRVLALWEDRYVSLPVNLEVLRMLYSREHARRVAQHLVDEYGYGREVPILKLRESRSEAVRRFADWVYEKVFYGYTVKQWGMEPEALDPSVTARVPVRISRDDRYFRDRYQALPAEGYAAMIERMLDQDGLEVVLGTDYREVIASVRFSRLVFTGPIDQFFDYCYGPLSYRSLRFVFENVATTQFQPVAQVNFPNGHAHTRCVEYKHMTGQSSPHTSISYEYPEPHEPGRNEPLYPVPQEACREQYRRYAADARKLYPTVLFVGRLAEYRYLNMDQAVARALRIFDREICP